MKGIFPLGNFYFSLAMCLLMASATVVGELSAQNAPVTTLASVTACPATAVSVTAKVTGFNNISGMTLYLLYPSANLTFSSGSGNPSLPGFFMSPPISAGNGLMRISVQFAKFGGGGITLANNATLFTCNFSYIGGTAPVVFENAGDYSCEYTVGLEPLVDDPASAFYFDGGVTPKPLPAAGTISGPSAVVPGTTGLIYSTPSLPNAVSYSWAVPAGFTIVSGNGSNTISADASSAAQSGNVTVSGVNSCSIAGPVASFAVQTGRQLSITYYPEGLFNGTGLNKAQGSAGDQFPGTTADKVTLKLHAASDYSSVVYVLPDATLSTSGTVVANIPYTYDGNYTISVHHRNSVEIASASAVAFNTGLVNYNFTDAPSKAYGNNLKSSGAAFVAFGGDVNQDGVVDGLDLVAADNQAAVSATGYVAEDFNGDGLVNSVDLLSMAANAALFVSQRLP